MNRILIVEDSPTQAKLLRLVLEENGFDAEVAGEGDAALAQLAASPFDLVISDIVMPRLSGYDLCRKIKAERRWNNIPVILLTTRKDPMDIFRGLECGADNFYTKPYDPDRLIERIHTILRNRAMRTQTKLKVGIEISFLGQTFVVGSDKEQILDLLISTFEDIVQTNLDLEKSQMELANAKAKIEEYAGLLEIRIRTSDEKHRAIIEGVTEGIITLDEWGIVTSINPAAQNIFSYAADEVIGQNVAMLMAEPYRSQHDAYLESYRRSGVAKIVGKVLREVEGRRKDGTVFPINLAVSEMKIGERREFIGVTRDLTSQKATEQQLYEAQKMEAIGNLTGGMAHDFNNLLGVIIGNLDLLLDVVKGNPNSEELATEALDAALRGADLTRRLLAFARRQPLRPQLIDVNRHVDGIGKLLARTLGEQNELKFAFAEDVWPVVADPAQLEASLINLATNARDAMPKGGRLAIRTANRALDEDYAAPHAELRAGDYVMIEVGDTGEGMPSETLNRIFEPFFTTKELGKGTGLGLSMVFGFMKQSGGHINVYSEPGVGTTFRLYLPRSVDVAVAAEPRQAAPPVRGHNETILVVEDNERLRRVVVRQLGELAYKVIEAEDAAGALAVLEREPVDLLFTDIVMPGGTSGYELARTALARWPAMKAVLTSGFPDMLLDGNDGIVNMRLLSKPYRKDELGQTVQEALQE